MLPRIVGLILLFLCPFFRAVGLAADSNPIASKLTTAESLQLQREARVVVDLLQNHNYTGRAFREIENREMITRYLGELDPQNYFLTEEDNEFLRRRFDRTFKTVYLFKGDLRPAFEIFDYFATRARERITWIEQQLAGDFDFNSDETIPDLAALPAPANKTEADRRWQLRLKEQLLRELLVGRTMEEAKRELLQSYGKSRHRIASYDPRTVRADFFDAIIRSFDPHSGYFSAEAAREFSLEMGGPVAGIGLDLRVDDGRYLVDAVQPGSSAELNSTIKPGCLIVALADGEGAWVETAGKRLGEVVELIRGKQDTTIRIAYQETKEGERHEVTLRRQYLVISSNLAQGAVSEVAGADGKRHRIGWINLPSFYGATEDGSTSAAKDVRELIGRMNEPALEGLVMDLRENPGGLLTEAVALSGLFVSKGPVMLSRAMGGKTREMMITEGQPAYNGPLVILTSPHSASASEVFAGAMHFHRRAMVIGEASTFGKGTMQAYIELARTSGSQPAPGTETWGTLRITTERFFLPDGIAVQFNGIPSDVVLPAQSADQRKREADLPLALPGDPIIPPKPAQPSTETSPEGFSKVIENLRQHHKDNAAQLAEWKLWQDEQTLWTSFRKRTSRSMNLEVRKKQRKEDLAQLQSLRHARRELTVSAVFPTLAVDLQAVEKAQSARLDKRKAERAAGSSDGKCRLQTNLLIVETDDGLIREIPLRSLNFDQYLGDAESLAQTFTAATSASTGTAEIELLLQDLARQDTVTDKSLLDAALARIPTLAEDRPRAKIGLEALLGQLVRLDGETLRERPGLDIPLREALRLTAAWVDWQALPQTSVQSD